MKTATTIAAADVDLETRLQCAELWEKVWPSAQDSQDLEARLERVATAYAAQEQQQWHLGIDDHRVVAVARTFHHTVRVGPTSTAVLALASVCSDPAVRGDGWGTAVAAASLKRSIDEGCPACSKQGCRTSMVGLALCFSTTRSSPACPIQNPSTIHSPWSIPPRPRGPQIRLSTCWATGGSQRIQVARVLQTASALVVWQVHVELEL